MPANIPISEADRQIAEIAFTLWLSSAFRGAPEEALFTALQMIGGNPPRLFLVPERKSMRTNVYPINATRRRLKERSQ